MRKKAEYPFKVCSICGKTFQPTNAVQKYCFTCKTIADKERKRKYYIKHFPNAYAVKKKEVCCICGEPMVSHFDGKPYCNKHWQRMYRHGTAEQPKRKVKNKYYIFDNVAIGVTSKGDFFKIDLEDLWRCKQHSWIKDDKGYFVATINKKRAILHRFILNVTDSKKHIDHKNGNKSDNCKINLRICNSKQNSKNIARKKNNKSGYPGIRKIKTVWKARITVNRKEISLGSYKTFYEALRARQDAEIKYYGEFAPCLTRIDLLK